MAFERPESEAPSNLNRFQERTEDAASRARSVPLRMITELVFRFLSEDEPSNARRSVVDLGWPGWRERFESRGGRKGPSTAACREALVKYMPGIEPLVDSLVDAAGGDEEMIPAARMVRIGWLEGLTQAWDFVSPPPDADPGPLPQKFVQGVPAGGGGDAYRAGWPPGTGRASRERFCGRNRLWREP